MLLRWALWAVRHGVIMTSFNPSARIWDLNKQKNDWRS